MKMKLTLLRGFTVIGESTITLYPERMPIDLREATEEGRARKCAEVLAQWMFSVELAINVDGKIRAHLEQING